MRRNIVHPGADELTYAIREIVTQARRLEALGVPITWENIGDPVRKGESVPEWIKTIVADLAQEDDSYAYSDTQGDPHTRAFLAEKVNQRGGAQIHPDDILFFNGLGDAISKIYGFLRREARVIGPSPAYSTHSSAEGAHAGDAPITYTLNPERGWLPDVEELRQKVRYNPSIAGILIVNPDNPTGIVYPRALLEEVVGVARKHDLFLVFDEVYINLVYGDTPIVPLSDVIGDVCGISLKGISKEVPWPGARCGWAEMYNRDRDPVFARYTKSLADAKMLEVCSTTLPQRAIPRILSHPGYAAYLAKRNATYEARAREACEILERVDGIHVVCPQGAFYMVVLFDRDVLDLEMSLDIAEPDVRRAVEAMTGPTAQPDYRFVYYLMGATGIVVVPLSSFCCERMGLRITLLESDDAKRRWTFETLADAIERYLASGRAPAAAPLLHPPVRS